MTRLTDIYKGVLVPHTGNKQLQSMYCHVADCGGVSCSECLFMDDNLELFEEWRAENETKEG